MDFNVPQTINHPLDMVYVAYRDRLADMVPYLPNVDELRVESREQTERGIALVNFWKVSGGLPRAVRPLFKEGAMTYLDHADWDDAEQRVRWWFEMGMFPEAVDCRGVNYFRPGPTEGTTIVELTGALTVDLAKVRGVPRFLRGLAPKVESFVIGRVKPNLTSVGAAVGRFLDEGGAT